MKLLSLLLLFSSLSIHAETITLEDFNYPISDISEKGVTKEDLFTKMNRRLVRIHDSICSNRAHVWAYDFKNKNIEAGKIFLFFTPKTGGFGGTSWWYHASPVVNENGKLWVMDAGFPWKIAGPLGVDEWLKSFNGETSVCKEMTSEHKDLAALIYEESSFPETTKHGTYNCYYRITPPGYWIPSQVANQILGTFARDEFEDSEVLEACMETSTSPFGWAMGRNYGVCRNFIDNLSQNLISEY